MSHISYHNTVPVAGTELLEAVRAAEKQDEAILAVFASGCCWSPSEVHRYFARAGKQWPLTSVRRAITNLTKAKKLVQTGQSIVGPYGRRENVWSRA